MDWGHQGLKAVSTKVPTYKPERNPLSGQQILSYRQHVTAKHTACRAQWRKHVWEPLLQSRYIKDKQQGTEAAAS